MHIRYLLLCLLILSACGTASPAVDDLQTSSVSYSSEDLQETKNVSYRGTLESVGPSIYQQGTHMLSLGDGRMILLESTLVDFEPFIGESVEVFGALRPTVEAGGIIMRVEQITSLSSGSEHSFTSHSVVSVESASVMSVHFSDSPSSASSIKPISSSSPFSIPVSAVHSSFTVSSTAPSAVDPFRTEKIVKMSKEDISAARWTQLYCSSHIGFCVPVHKNWWYVSFGNKAHTLWHVEVSSEEFEALGSGIIRLDLIGGDIATAGHTDGEVVVSESTVTGYRSWTQGRHFAIAADAKLEGVVRYMTEQLRVME